MPTHHGGECIRLPAGTANNGSPVVLPRRHPRAFRAHARASHRRNSPLARAEAKKLAPRLPRQKAAARAAAAKEAALADKARALARRAPALPHNTLAKEHRRHHKRHAQSDRANNDLGRRSHVRHRRPTCDDGGGGRPAAPPRGRHRRHHPRYPHKRRRPHRRRARPSPCHRHCPWPPCRAGTTRATGVSGGGDDHPGGGRGKGWRQCHGGSGGGATPCWVGHTEQEGGLAGEVDARRQHEGYGSGRGGQDAAEGTAAGREGKG